MFTAQDIVSLLLETEDGPRLGGIQSGVYVFPPGSESQGLAYPSLGHMLQSFVRFGRLRAAPGEDPRNLLDGLIRQGYTIIEKKDPTDTVVYSSRLPVQLTPDVADRAMRYLGLDPESQIVHKKHFHDGTGKTISGEQLLYGSNEVAKAKEERERLGQQGVEKYQAAQKLATDQASAKAKEAAAKAKSARLVRYHDRYGRQQTIDPEKEGFHPRPEVTVGSVTPTAYPRGSLGLTYDKGYETTAMNEQEKGCMVAAVHDNGPLAMAGVQAGDLIQTATYVDDSGQQKEYRIRGHQNLTNALAAANPQYPMILHLKRGGQMFNVPVELAPPGQSNDTLRISGEEARRWAKEQDAKAQPTTAAASQAAPAQPPRQQPTRPRQLPLKGVIPARPRPQKTFRFTPNEPQPPSQTGNQPPNVSTLT